jgi:hypothetical protein
MVFYLKSLYEVLRIKKHLKHKYDAAKTLISLISLKMYRNVVILCGIFSCINHRLSDFSSEIATKKILI